MTARGNPELGEMGTFRAPARPRRIVFTHPQHARVLEAALGLVGSDLVEPVLVGDASKLRGRAADAGLGVAGIEILAPGSTAGLAGDFRGRWRARLAPSGVREVEADASLRDPATFAQALAEMGGASGVVYGPGPSRWGNLGTSYGMLWVRGPRTGLALVSADPGPHPSVMGLVEAAEITARMGAQLSGKVVEIVFLAPGVPVSLSRRSRFRSAREQLEERVAHAIDTLRVRMGEGRVVGGGLRFDLSGLEAPPEGRMRSFVLTQPEEAAGVRRMLGTLWSAGPVYRGGQLTWGELSEGHSVEEIRRIAGLTALSADTESPEDRSARA